MVVAAAVIAPATASASTPTPEQALAELNAWRAETGIAPVIGLDPEMNEGCRQHNAYMSLNGMGHEQDPAKPGASDLGAAAGSSSVISTGQTGPRAAWEGAVYHRTSILNPRLRTTWFDASSGYTCMGSFGTSDDDTARAPQLTLHPWPANGGRGVRTTFEGGESPDPYETTPGVDRLGFLLSVNVNGPWTFARGSTLTGVSLTPDGGAPVAVTGADVNSPNGWALDGGFGIFPHGALADATWYTAHATGYVTAVADGGTVTQYPFDYTWRFQTRLLDPGTDVEIDGAAVTVRTSSPAPVHVTVTRDGRVVAQRDLANKQTFSLAAGAGSYQVCATQAESGRYAGYDQCQPLTVNGCTTAKVTGKLRGRTLRATVTATPAAGQALAVRAQRRARRCRRFPDPNGGKGTVRACEDRWVTFKKLARKAKNSQTVRFTVKTSDKTVRVSATVASASIDGARYPAKTAGRTFRR